MKLFVEYWRIQRGGMSVAELSRLSGVSATHIKYIESGTRMPTIEVLCKLSKALEVPCKDLYTCDGYESEPDCRTVCPHIGTE